MYVLFTFVIRVFTNLNKFLFNIFVFSISGIQNNWTQCPNLPNLSYSSLDFCPKRTAIMIIKISFLSNMLTLLSTFASSHDSENWWGIAIH